MLKIWFLKINLFFRCMRCDAMTLRLRNRQYRTLYYLYLISSPKGEVWFQLYADGEFMNKHVGTFL